MSHARIEEVNSSDEDHASDPSEADISEVHSDFDELDILKRIDPPSSKSKFETSSSSTNPSLISPSQISTASSNTGIGSQFRSATDNSIYRDFQCIYPVYFDKNRSRKQGRRVGIKNAVENPLARTIVDACGGLGLETLFEPLKIHPKDWANPGRVKVNVKGGSNGVVKSKHHLYSLISKHLLANPTTERSALKVLLPGVPPPDPKKPFPKPAIPKGWKMGSILPYYGAAITGGGVSENFLKDMMAEMQTQGGMPGMGGLMPGMMEGMLGGAGGTVPAQGPSGTISSKKDKTKGKKGKG